MSVSTKVDVTGVADALESLEKVLPQARDAVGDIFKRAAVKGSNVAKKRLTQKQSGYSEGILRSSIRPFTEDGGLVAGVRAGGSKTNESGFDYALAVEFGTRPHFPPVKAVTGQIESLDIWVRRMNPSPPEGMENASEAEANESVAFLIARKISRVGTKEMPYMRPAFNAAKGVVIKDLRSLEDDLDL